MGIISTYLLKKSPAWFVSWSFRKIFGRKDLIIFERLLEIPKWKKVSTSPNEKWIFEDDNSFVIETSGEHRNFTEDWTDRFPDKNSQATEVFLKINGELVEKSFLFIEVDGFRYFVPCPKIGEINGESYRYWDKESIEYKIFKRIGNTGNIHTDLESFGRRCGVLIK
ncbi:hypothetical protein KKC45_02315 [Patescibacteria group bacterium]|nr:hypothetical protein [Patescibacteria group bacterium]